MSMHACIGGTHAARTHTLTWLRHAHAGQMFSACCFGGPPFADRGAFDGNVGSWNVGKVKDFRYFFRNQKAFDKALAWDTSSATSFVGMFESASNFNNGGSAGIDGWNTGQLENADSIFNGASRFNQPMCACPAQPQPSTSPLRVRAHG